MQLVVRAANTHVVFFHPSTHPPTHHFHLFVPATCLQRVVFDYSSMLVGPGNTGEWGRVCGAGSRLPPAATTAGQPLVLPPGECRCSSPHLPAHPCEHT